MADEDFENTHVKPRTCLSINIIVLRLLGVWFPEEEQKTWRSRLYTFYSILTQGFLLQFYLITEAMNIMKLFGDLLKMADASYLFITHMATLTKFYYFRKHSVKMFQLLDGLEAKIFKPKNDAQLKILNWAMFRSKTDSIILLSMAFVTCVCWSIFPFVEKTTGHIKLPLPAWYPFNVTISPNFELIYTYQFIATFCDGAMNIAMDTVATGIFIHICAQLDMLSDKLENMKRDSILRLEKKKKRALMVNESFAEDNFIYTPQELESEMTDNLKDCVKHHYEIIRYAEEIENIFNDCFLVQFFTSVVIICLVLFKLSTVKSFLTIEFLSLLLYQGCIIFELFYYCYHGNEMILKGSLLSNSIYHSAWYEFSPKFSKQILMIMMRTTRPIRITAGKFFFLSLSSFTGVLRLSWSYYAVLSGMEEK